MRKDIARAALDAGHAVVATGRIPEKVAEAVGMSDDLLDQLVAQLQTQYDVRIDQAAVAQALTR